ncbi:hypothetical protein GCK32_004294 [Trichostrongylus colubriformis]|uniref:Uncharacterized protein n=1 Tax=Trichostrongylus colubriformis TaxID=6319 RepID=A0AAN8G4E2_TRICO
MVMLNDYLLVKVQRAFSAFLNPAQVRFQTFMLSSTGSSSVPPSYPQTCTPITIALYSMIVIHTLLIVIVYWTKTS